MSADTITYTHLCKSTDLGGKHKSTPHTCLESAIRDQNERENCGHYGVVVMPVPFEARTVEVAQADEVSA